MSDNPTIKEEQERWEQRCQDFDQRHRAERVRATSERLTMTVASVEAVLATFNTMSVDVGPDPADEERYEARYMSYFQQYSEWAPTRIEAARILSAGEDAGTLSSLGVFDREGSNLDWDYVSNDWADS